MANTFRNWHRVRGSHKTAEKKLSNFRPFKAEQMPQGGVKITIQDENGNQLTVFLDYESLIRFQTDLNEAIKQETDYLRTKQY